MTSLWADSNIFDNLFEGASGASNKQFAKWFEGAVFRMDWMKPETGGGTDTYTIALN